MVVWVEAGHPFADNSGGVRAEWFSVVAVDQVCSHILFRAVIRCYDTGYGLEILTQFDSSESGLKTPMTTLQIDRLPAILVFITMTDKAESF